MSLEEYARLTRLIDNMLFLARADGPRTGVKRASFDARQAIEAVREFYDAMAEERGVKVRCEGQGMVKANPLFFSAGRQQPALERAELHAARRPGAHPHQ